MLSRRSSYSCLVIIAILFAAMLGGCRNELTGQAQVKPAPLILRTRWVQPTGTLTGQIPAQPTTEGTATLIALGPLFDPNIDLMAGPIDVPLELLIPSLKVKAPVIGVGLTSKNVMNTPKGPIGDPIWDAAYWYRGSGIPGESGTATIAGHVNEPLGEPEIFADLEDLHPGDEIIIHYSTIDLDILFIVDQIEVYSIQESSEPAVLAQIFGDGPLAGKGPQPARDGLAHLTLITCAGNIVNGEFDHHTVVFATRRP